MRDWSFGLKEIFPQKPKAKNSAFKIQSYQRMTFPNMVVLQFVVHILGFMNHFLSERDIQTFR